MIKDKRDQIIRIHNEGHQAEPGCCVDMLCVADQQIKGRNLNISQSPTKISNLDHQISLNLRRAINSNPHKNKSIIKIAEPKQTIYLPIGTSSSDNNNELRRSAHKLSETSHPKQIINIKQKLIIKKQVKSIQSQNQLQYKIKNQSETRKSINAIKSSQITINISRTNKQQNIPIVVVEEKQLDMSGYSHSYVYSAIKKNNEQVQMSNSKSLIQPATARGSISFNNIERNESKQSLEVSEQEDSPLLHKSVVSFNEGPSEPSVNVSNVILKMPVMGFKSNSSSLDKFNIKRTQSIDYGHNLSPMMKPKTNHKIMTFAEEGLSDISDHHWEEEDRLPNTMEPFRKIMHFEQIFDRGGFIGAGRVSSVYIVQDKATNFVYASKQIFKKIVEKEDMVEKVRKEVIQHLSLNYNQNVLSLCGAFEDTGRYYFVTELCETNLRKVIKKPLDQDKAMKYVKDILKGLKVLHRNNIVHGKLKPQNIYLNGNTCKIGDFGWVSTFEQSNGIQIGWDYSSPQQKNKQKISDKIDLWSLGVIAYQMVIGKLPLLSSDNLFSANQDDMSNLTQKYIQILKGFLKINPSQRLTIPKAFQKIESYFPCFQSTSLIEETHM